MRSFKGEHYFFTYATLVLLAHGFSSLWWKKDSIIPAEKETQAFQWVLLFIIIIIFIIIITGKHYMLILSHHRVRVILSFSRPTSPLNIISILSMSLRWNENGTSTFIYNDLQTQPFLGQLKENCLLQPNS